jgi:heme A synthase
LRWLPVAVAGVVFMQIVFGAIVRHTYSMGGLKHHLTGAFAVTIAVVWLIRATWRSEDRPLRRAGFVLFTVTVLQLLMGIEVFMGRFFTVRSALHQTGVRTVHVLLGFLLFSSVVALAALARRAGSVSDRSLPEPQSELRIRPVESETVLAHAGAGEGDA